MPTLHQIDIFLDEQCTNKYTTADFQFDMCTQYSGVSFYIPSCLVATDDPIIYLYGDANCLSSLSNVALTREACLTDPLKASGFYIRIDRNFECAVNTPAPVPVQSAVPNPATPISPDEIDFFMFLNGDFTSFFDADGSLQRQILSFAIQTDLTATLASIAPGTVVRLKGIRSERCLSINATATVPNIEAQDTVEKFIASAVATGSAQRATLVKMDSTQDLYTLIATIPFQVTVVGFPMSTYATTDFSCSSPFLSPPPAPARETASPETARGNQQASSSNGIPLGAIIGGAGGAVLIIILVVAGLCCYMMRRNNQQRSQSAASANEPCSSPSGSVSAGAVPRNISLPKHYQGATVTSYGYVAQTVTDGSGFAYLV